MNTWRRLQHCGAVPFKNGVYVLPHSTQSLEDFAWLRAEIQGLEGQAGVFAASSAEGIDDMDIIEQFKSARGADDLRLLGDVRRVRADAQRQRGPSMGF